MSKKSTEKVVKAAGAPRQAARKEDKSLESWIWDAACSIRGAKDAPKYKDYILPLIFTKRLCDVFDDELNRIAAEVGSRKKAFQLARADHKLVRFYLPLVPDDPEQPVWSVIRKLADRIGEGVTTDQLRNQNDEGRERPQRAHETVRAKNYPPIREPAEIHRSAGSRKATSALGNIRRGELPRGASRTQQGRVHCEMWRFAPRTGGERLLVRTACRSGNRTFIQAPTAPSRMRRTDRHLRHDYQECASGPVAGLLPSSFRLQTSKADTLIGWKEEEKLSRIVDHAELKKNDYNISPSRYIHTSDAETYRPLAEIVADLDAVEAEAREADAALREILRKIGV